MNLILKNSEAPAEQMVPIYDHVLRRELKGIYCNRLGEFRKDHKTWGRIPCTLLKSGHIQFVEETVTGVRASRIVHKITPLRALIETHCILPESYNRHKPISFIDGNAENWSVDNLELKQRDGAYRKRDEFWGIYAIRRKDRSILFQVKVGGVHLGYVHTLETALRMRDRGTTHPQAVVEEGGCWAVKIPMTSKNRYATQAEAAREHRAMLDGAVGRRPGFFYDKDEMEGKLDKQNLINEIPVKINSPKKKYGRS